MPDRSTNRLYGGIFFEDHVTSDPEAQHNGHRCFHWAIIVESKDRRTFHVFKVKYQPRMEGLVPIPAGWKYEAIYDARPSHRMLAKVMIGKLPLGINEKDIGTALEKVPLPNSIPGDGSAESCFTWTQQAIAALQNLDSGDIVDDNIDIASCIEFCETKGDEAYRSNPRLNKEIACSNFTNRPMSEFVTCKK
jgi:hypothetical protein